MQVQLLSGLMRMCWKEQVKVRSLSQGDESVAVKKGKMSAGRFSVNLIFSKTNYLTAEWAKLSDSLSLILK